MAAKVKRKQVKKKQSFLSKLLNPKRKGPERRHGATEDVFKPGFWR